jgi:hypothetical protein
MRTRNCAVRTAVLFLAALAALPACSDPPSAGPGPLRSTPASACGGEDGGCQDGATPDAEAAADPLAPRIVSLATNVKEYAWERYPRPEPEPIVFTAVVTDPDNDLIGGTLSDPDGGTYGAFASGSGQGAYSLALTYKQIDAVRPVYSGRGGGPRTFIATFTDNAGRSTSRRIDVRFRCSPSQWLGYEGFDPKPQTDPSRVALCSSVCTELSDADRCGACDTFCERRGDVWPACRNDACLPVTRSRDAGTCAAYCQSLGLACKESPSGVAQVSYARRLDLSRESSNCTASAVIPTCNSPIARELPCTTEAGERSTAPLEFLTCNCPYAPQRR